MLLLADALIMMSAGKSKKYVTKKVSIFALYLKSMIAEKADIIRQLQKDILSLQGFRPPSPGSTIDIGLGKVMASFPNQCFPTGAIHEFISHDKEQEAVCSGFIATLAGALMQANKVAVWVGTQKAVFPASLKVYGIAPEKVIFINVNNNKQVLWIIEEVLKCEGLAAVIGEVRDIGFVESRRLQLAVEQSRVTGFILRHQPRQLTTTACVSRWQIEALPSEPKSVMPGLGFARWKISLLKARNGKTGSWQMEWYSGAFHQITNPIPSLTRHHRKTG